MTVLSAVANILTAAVVLIENLRVVDAALEKRDIRLVENFPAVL